MADTLTGDIGSERAATHVKCAVKLTDNDETHAGDNPRLSLNRGLANWRVKPG